MNRPRTLPDTPGNLSSATRLERRPATTAAVSAIPTDSSAKPPKSLPPPTKLTGKHFSYSSRTQSSTPSSLQPIGQSTQTPKETNQQLGNSPPEKIAPPHLPLPANPPPKPPLNHALEPRLAHQPRHVLRHLPRPPRQAPERNRAPRPQRQRGLGAQRPVRIAEVHAALELLEEAAGGEVREGGGVEGA